MSSTGSLHRFLLYVTIVLAVQWLWAGECRAAGSDFVLIEKSEAAYTAFAGLPQERVEEVRARIGDAKGAVIVEWDRFVGDIDEIMKGRIVKDEYPGSRVREGIVALVKKYPETAFGITWNGGIIVTPNEYRYARRTYGSYTADPAQYERTRIKDPGADPLNPKTHLNSLLGW